MPERPKLAPDQPQAPGIESSESSLPESMRAVLDYIDQAKAKKEEWRQYFAAPRGERANSQVDWEQFPRKQLRNRFESIPEIADVSVWLEFIQNIDEHYLGIDNQEQWQTLSDEGGYVKREGDMTVFNFLVDELSKAGRSFAAAQPEAIDRLITEIIRVIQKHNSDWGRRSFENVDEAVDRYMVFDTGQMDDIYNSISKLVVAVGRYGGKGTVEAIFQLLRDCRPGRAINYHNLADGLSAIDPVDSAHHGLEYLRDQSSRERLHNSNWGVRTTEQDARTGMAQLLRHLEFGKIGIYSDGIVYLEKLYQFDPDFQAEQFDGARRISPHGHVALFDRVGEMKKFFLLTDLDSPEEIVPAKLHDITLALLFEAREGETDEDKQIKAEILERFRRSYGEMYDGRFFQATSMHLNNLSLREQAWFMRFAMTALPERQDRALALVKEHGEVGLRTFLSLEYDAEAGDKIFSIQEKYGYHEASDIYAKYSALASAAEEVEQKLERFFVKEREAPTVKKWRVTEEIMRRAGRVLTEFAEKKIDPEAVSDVRQRLHEIQRDIAVFASIFRSFTESGEKIDYREIRGLDLQVLSGNALLDERFAAVKDDVRRIFAKNYADEPEIANKFRGQINPTTKEEADELLRNEFFILTRYDEGAKRSKPISFLRLEHKPEGGVYFAAFNVDPEMRGAGIGEQMLLHVIKDRARAQTITATFPPQSPVGTKYIDFGFVGTGYTTLQSGYERFTMAIGPEMIATESYVLPKKDDKLLLAQYQVRAGAGEYDPAASEEDIVLAVYDAVEEKDQVAATARALFAKGYVLTKYVRLDKRNHRRLYGFEKKIVPDAK